MRSLSLFLATSFSFFLFACGGHNGSTGGDEVEFSSSSVDDFNVDDYLDTAAIGSGFNSGMGSATIVKGEVSDYRSDRPYKTIQFGPYVWMAENVNDGVRSSYGVCYDRDTVMCGSYGKLYKEEEASYLCPQGFSLPSEEDYKYMVRFAGSLTSSEFGFNPQMGGSCVEDKGALVCTNAGVSSDLVTDDYSYVRIKKNAGAIFGRVNPKGYYSVRCMKYTYFVETKKLLPECDSSSYRMGDIFVASEGSNFRCKDGKWVDAVDSYCPSSERGQRYYYNDILYVCDGSWKEASMNDLDEKCNSSNEWTVKKLNGKSYICENKEWRLPTEIEDSLGLCTPDRVAKIDSIVDSDTVLYFCSVNGWRKAQLTDFIGKCDSTAYYKVARHRGTHYTCRTTDKWDVLDWKEDSLGVCSPKIAGKMDTIKAKFDTTLYYCDTTSWREATVTDMHGVCDTAKHYKQVNFMGFSYTCRTSGRWESLTTTEKDIGVCAPSRIGKIDTTTSKADYYCDTTGWRSTVVEDYFGECTEKEKYSTLYFKGSDYGCEKGPKWTLLKYPESDLGYCIPSIKGEIRIDQYAKDYICDSVWRAATQAEVLGTCTEARDGEKKYFGTTKYICAFEAWRKSTTLDDSLGVCSKATLKKMGTYKSTDYVCLAEGWSVPTLISVHDSCTAAREYEVVEFNGTKYGCRNNRWNGLSGVTAKAGYCTPEKEGQFSIYSNESGYICKSGSWTSISVQNVLDECGSSTYGKKEILDGVTFFCARSGLWQRFTEMEEKYGECYSKVRGKIVTHDDGKDYGCAPSRWRLVTSLDEALGFCDGYGFKWKEYGGIDYVCGNNYRTWSNSSDWAMYGACDWRYEWKFGLTVGYQGQHYYCDTTLDASVKTKAINIVGWHEISPMDSLRGICKENLLGDTLTYKDRHYYCGLTEKGKYAWLVASNVENYLGKCDASRAGKKVQLNGWNMECSDGKWRRDSDDYGTFTDSRDGTRYKTIQIGKQVWMAEDLKYEVTGSWCGGNYNGCLTYGRLYNWATAMDLPASANTTLVDIKDSASYQGLCPTGWRIPLQAEWSEMYETCGTAKAVDSTQYMDICGFPFISLGYIKIFYRNGIDYTEELDMSYTGHWSTIQKSDTVAVARGSGIQAQKKFGYALRCIKK